jgi:glyoxylase-like metal-dependent hydrolase (beta-lactamase superfamily II)
VGQLESLGVDAGQIDLVLHTHLHFDHIGYNERFPNARFIVHRDELAWALCPPPYYRTFYYPAYARHVHSVLDRIELMDGTEHHVAPGIRMVHTGGHSPGHCAVFVDTAEGTAVIAGDAVANYRNLEHDWPGGIVFDLPACARAIQLLKRAQLILVNHDPSFAELFPTGRVGDEPVAQATLAYMHKLRNAADARELAR